MDSKDYKNIMETLHLLRFPANADRLHEGIRQHCSGQRKKIEDLSKMSFHCLRLLTKSVKDNLTDDIDKERDER